jgi:hypothetical protein
MRYEIWKAIAPHDFLARPGPLGLSDYQDSKRLHSHMTGRFLALI